MANEPTLDMSEIMDLYKADARRMIGEMRGAVGRWVEVVQGGPALQELRRLSHQLRGSGRTYGFRNVSRVSKAMEKIVQRLEKCRLPADDRTQRSLSTKVDRLAEIFKE